MPPKTEKEKKPRLRTETETGAAPVSERATTSASPRRKKKAKPAVDEASLDELDDDEPGEASTTSTTADPSPGDTWTGLGEGASRRELLWMGGLTFFVRIVYFFTANGPAFRNPLIDGDQYDFLAERIASGQGLPDEPFWQPPLFPLLLGALYRVCGHTFWAPRLCSALFTALTAALVTDLVRRASTPGRRWPALVAGGALALYGPSIFYDGELLPTALGTFLGTFALWVTLTQKPQLDRNILAGVVTGLAALALGPLLFLAPVLGFFASSEQRLGRAARAGRVLVTCLAALVIVSPVTVFNFRRSGELIPISANAGINLWIGNNPDADRTFAIRPGEAWEEMLAEPGQQGVTTAGGQDAYFARKARAFCAEQPLACAAGLARKARLLVVGREIPRNEDVYTLRRQSPLLAVTLFRLGSFAFPFGVIFPLAVAGLFVGLGRAAEDDPRRRVTLATLGAALALAAGPVIFLVAGRYRLPLVPALLLLGGIALDGLFAPPDEAPSRRWAWPPTASLGAALALGLTLWPAHLAVDAIDFEAEMWFVVGGRRERLQDTEGAIASYRHALERRPNYTEAGYNLGILLEKKDRSGEAVEVYRGLLRAEPGMFGVRYRLIQALLSSERLDEAARELDEMQRELPDNPMLMTSRAKLLLLKDDVPGAKQWTARALETTRGQHQEAEALMNMIERIEKGKGPDDSERPEPEEER
jgi:tetratricopeptide (TPR) repeat protein